MRVSRRRLLRGGAAAALATGAGAAYAVEDGLLPGRPFAQALLGLNGAAGVVPDVTPGPVERGTFVSPARLGETTRWALTRPPGMTGPLPLVVALHGLGASSESLMAPRIALPSFLAASVAAGTPPYAIASVDGGRTYWHPRPSGEDAGAMVTDELLPILARHGVDTSRIGLIGWSMGGYGVLRLAGLLGSARVPAVAAVSPALWTDADDASPEGFADAEEYDAFSVMDAQEDLAGTAVRIDCGTGDRFYRAAQEYASRFPDGADVSAHFAPGAHAAAYWRRVLPAQLAFLGARVGSQA